MSSNLPHQFVSSSQIVCYKIVMSRTNIIARYMHHRLICSKHQSTKLPIESQKRHKTDDSSKADIVVEKEKKQRSWTFGTLNWDALPKKVAKLGAYVQEIKNHPTEQRMQGRAFRDDEILYYFRDKEDLNNWDVTTDKSLGGKSWAEFIQSENGMTASFRGHISQRLPRYMLPSTYDQLEDKPFYKGFAKLETKPFLSAFGQYDIMSIMGCNVIEIRLRGEGRKYLFEMLLDYGIAEFMYIAPMHTRGGPNWESVKIPYGKFICTKRNVMTYDQDTFHPGKVSSFRFLLLDGIEGPFQLELDYIALKKDDTENPGESDYWDPHQHTNMSIGTW